MAHCKMNSKRIQNPHVAVTGSPEIPAMSVNSIDNELRAKYWLFRSQSGGLWVMNSDRIPVHVSENLFNIFCESQHNLTKNGI